MVTREDVETRYQDTAQAQLTRYSFTFDSALTGVTDKLIETGVATLDEAGMLGDADMVDLAEAQLVGLINKMILQAKLDGKSEIDMPTFSMVFGFCCPGCWPFC